MTFHLIDVHCLQGKGTNLFDQQPAFDSKYHNLEGTSWGSRQYHCRPFSKLIKVFSFNLLDSDSYKCVTTILSTFSSANNHLDSIYTKTKRAFRAIR